MANWSRNTRRDMRPINAEGTAEGVRGAHRGMRGELVGGYMPQADGSMKAFGTKEAGGGTGGNALGGGLARWERKNPNAKKAFSPGSPAAGRAPAPAPAAPMPAPAPASSFVDAAMPEPKVPAPMTGALRRPKRMRPQAYTAGGALRRPARPI